MKVVQKLARQRRQRKSSEKSGEQPRKFISVELHDSVHQDSAGCGVQQATPRVGGEGRQRKGHRMWPAGFSGDLVGSG